MDDDGYDDYDYGSHGDDDGDCNDDGIVMITKIIMTMTVTKMMMTIMITKMIEMMIVIVMILGNFDEYCDWSFYDDSGNYHYKITMIIFSCANKICHFPD